MSGGSDAGVQDIGKAFASRIAQVKQQQEAFLQENKRLKALISVQNTLVEKHRQALAEVAKTSAELAAIEKQRIQLKQKLSAQKSKLLVGASEAAEMAAIVERSLERNGVPAIANSEAGSVALNAITKIQAALAQVVQASLKSEDLSVSSDDMTALICNVSDILESATKTGAVSESLEDQVKRQALVISSLLPGDDGEGAGEPEEAIDDEQVSE
jgi:hypothetical protein